MKQESIVSILGLALLMWWVSTGKTKVRSIQEDVKHIEKLSEPWLKAPFSHTEKKHSLIYTNLRSIVADSKNLLAAVEQTFKGMTRSELLAYMTEDIPEIAEEVGKFESAMTEVKITISQKDSYVDGPFEIKTLAETDQIDDIIIALQFLLKKTHDIGQDLMRQLGFSAEDMAKSSERLNASLRI